ncbi:YoaK family protein [Lacisediminimonas profundi]|uniref:YoaK family protein n=1 Tax=Lacisediminimonas profundi TaxID=2603856 RepID=UPI00124B60E5|nr:YoaK family protein [Lacisediminimonas profundi]
MPIDYARKLTGRHRTPGANRHLGIALAFVAGAINAGGFLAVHQYTSHMSGIVSSMADNLALGEYGLVLSAGGALLSFLLGAATSSILVNYARRHRLRSEFALPLLFEAVLLLAFGILGVRLSAVDVVVVLPVTVMLLTFLMGLQNAVITKISKAEIRTTHITGIVTDIGIELGKLVYWNRAERRSPVFASRERLAVLCALAFAFFLGGYVGAVGFQAIGYLATVPLAFLLVTLAGVPVLDDFAIFLARARR